MSTELTQKIRDLYVRNPEATPDELLKEIQRDVVELVKKTPHSGQEQAQPHVILIVGVNGNGKTTSVAKLANLYHKQGKKFFLVLPTHSEPQPLSSLKMGSTAQYRNRKRSI